MQPCTQTVEQTGAQMPPDRLTELLAIAEIHPDMSIQDALTATARTPGSLRVDHYTHYDEHQERLLYRAAALQGLVGAGQTAAHVAELADRYADAMIARSRPAPRAARAELPTLPDAGHCPVCGSLMHMELGRLRCRVCPTPISITVPESEEGGL